MQFPEELKYVKSHEWIKVEGDQARIGISDYAQDALGDLVFVNLPEVGDEVEAGDGFADVESVKAVSDIYSPVSGIVAAVNEELMENPEKINVDPYGAWLILVEKITETEECMDAAQYREYIENQE